MENQNPLQSESTQAMPQADAPLLNAVTAEMGNQQAGGAGETAAISPTVVAAANVAAVNNGPNNKLQLLQEAILGGNVPQMVLNTISYALELRSSDIHIEPETFTVRIRYRIDGVLRQIVEYPLKALHNQ